MSNLAHHSWGKQDRLNDAHQVPGITNVLHMNVCIPKEAISDTPTQFVSSVSPNLERRIPNCSRGMAFVKMSAIIILLGQYLEFDLLFLDVVTDNMELGADVLGSFVLARVLRDCNCTLIVTVDNDCLLREAKFFQQFGVPE